MRRASRASKFLILRFQAVPRKSQVPRSMCPGAKPFKFHRSSFQFLKLQVPMFQVKKQGLKLGLGSHFHPKKLTKVIPEGPGRDPARRERQTSWKRGTNLPTETNFWTDFGCFLMDYFDWIFMFFHKSFFSQKKTVFSPDALTLKRNAWFWESGSISGVPKTSQKWKKWSLEISKSTNMEKTPKI